MDVAIGHLVCGVFGKVVLDSGLTGPQLLLQKVELIEEENDRGLHEPPANNIIVYNYTPQQQRHTKNNRTYIEKIQ